MTTEPSDYVIIIDVDGDRQAFERASMSVLVFVCGGYAACEVSDRHRIGTVGIWRHLDAATEARDIILSGAAEVRLTRCPEAP